MARSAITDLDVAQAIDHEITTWRENVKHALTGVQLPQIDCDGFLKSCAWLSFGKDAVKVVAPRSSANALIQWVTSDAIQMAPPVFLLSQAATAFDSIYEATLREHNRLVNARYDEVRNQYFNKIDDQARVFRSTPYGTQIIRQVVTFLAGRTFEEVDKSTYLRLLLHRSRFIETDIDRIRAPAVEGFTGLCTMIYNIYLGSHRGPGYDNEIRIMSGQRYIGQYGSGEYYRTVRSEEEQDRILAQAWRYTGHHDDAHWFFEKERRDTTSLRETANTQPLRVPQSWRGPALALREGSRLATAAFRSETGRELQ